MTKRAPGRFGTHLGLAPTTTVASMSSEISIRVINPASAKASAVSAAWLALVSISR